jgi:FkbM family methyltransferase
VYAFEPTSTVGMLEQNLKFQGCKNVSVHRQALSNKPGRRTERIYRQVLDPAAPEETECDFTTIDEFVASEQMARLDLIKIDVDGYDFEVLQGAEATLALFNPWVVVELNWMLETRGSSRGEVLAWMANRGYNEALVLDGENFVFHRGFTPAASANWCYTMVLRA